MSASSAAGDTALANIRLQIMWNRLLSVVEEQAQTLIRTAFSTSVREAGDLSAGVFDAKGRMLAQAVTGTPRPRQCHGRERRAFPRALSAGEHGRGRRLRHQRPVARHGASA